MMERRHGARDRTAALLLVACYLGVLACGCGEDDSGVVRISDLGGTAGTSGGADDDEMPDAGVGAAGSGSDGTDVTTSAGGGGSGGGSTFQGQRGDPSDLDTGRVYLLGGLPGDTTSIYGGGCTASSRGIPDWASTEEDRMTPEGYVGAVPCEASRAQLRVDGSVVYSLAGRSLRLFFQDDGVPDHPEFNDNQLADCPNFGHFFHWAHPQDGRVVYSCRAPEDDMGGSGDGPPLAHYVASRDDQDPVYPVEEGWIIQHLGHDEYALVTQRDTPGPLAVWDGAAETLSEVGDTEFGFAQIQAVRATGDGFGLLIHEQASPPQLSLWQVGYDGEVERLGSYPTIQGYTVDRCTAVPFNEVPQVPRGCSCALDETGAAVCIASPGDDLLSLPGSAPAGGIEVLRFEPGAGAAEVVFDVADYAPLEDVMELFTGA